MFCGTGRLGLYLLPMGLADARMLVRALSVVMMPALAIDTVCCSMTSCSTDRVESDILSNSSMQHTPPSDSTSAPDSSTSCRVSGSRVTYAVRPTAEDPLPLVYTPRGAILWMYCSSCDLDVDGSPHSRMLMSPRYLGLPPFSNDLLVPPNSCSRMPFLTSSISYTLGASDLASSSYTSGRAAVARILASSSSLTFLVSSTSAETWSDTSCSSVDTSTPMRRLSTFCTWRTSTYVLKRLLIVLCRGLMRAGLPLKMPVTSIRSPALHMSTSSSYTQSDTECGVCPSGTRSGVS